MRGILDLDAVCLAEIFKNLTLLDLCSMRQCSKRLQYFVDDYLHSLYFVREQLLDLSNENIGNVHKILSNFGKFVRYLKLQNIWEDVSINQYYEAIATNCGDILKGLTLIRFQDIDMTKFVGLFDNLEILELDCCCGRWDRRGIENFLLRHEYPNLTTLIINFGHLETVQMSTEVLKKFFMRKRSIKKFICTWFINSDLLPLIVLNASELEYMHIYMLEGAENVRNVMLVAQLRNLKGLQIDCRRGRMSTIALIKELSFTTELEMLGIYHLEFNDELFDAVSKLTNLKVLRFFNVRFTLGTTSIEQMSRKLSKLSELKLRMCSDFPYRKFLATACKSVNFRTIYIFNFNRRDDVNFIKQMVRDFIKGRVHRHFVSGNPLRIYLNKDMFNSVKSLLTEYNFKYENIKILPADNKLIFE